MVKFGGVKATSFTVNSGTTITASSSANGATWTTVGTVTVSMTGSVYVGLAVCSHTTTVLNTSTFDNVTISSVSSAPAYADADIGAVGLNGSSSLQNGVYTVKYHVVTPDDNGVTDGSFKFTVGQVIAAPPTPTSAPFNGKISIISPKEGATMPAGQVTVQVGVDGVKLGPDYHWHLSVDGKEVAMVEDGKDSATTSLTPGNHEIGASLADAGHDDLVHASVHVTVAGATLPTTGGNASNGTLLFVLLGLAAVAVGMAAMRLQRRKA